MSNFAAWDEELWVVPGVSQQQCKGGLCREIQSKAVSCYWDAGASQRALTQQQETVGTVSAKEHGCSTGAQAWLSPCCSNVLCRHRPRRNMLLGGLSHHHKSSHLYMPFLLSQAAWLTSWFTSYLVSVMTIPGNIYKHSLPELHTQSPFHITKISYRKPGPKCTGSYFSDSLRSWGISLPNHKRHIAVFEWDVSDGLFATSPRELPWSSPLGSYFSFSAWLCSQFALLCQQFL